MIVVWRVTEQCNLSCGFCAFDRRLNRVRNAADPAYVRKFGSALAQHQRVSGETILVSWLGGEPLLWSPLAELTRYFTRDLGLSVSTTTNGTALHQPSVREHLIEYYRELTVSVDAIGEKHDILRGAPGLFSRVRGGMRLLARERDLREAPLKLRVNVVLMRSTFDEFSLLCRELATWGVQEISFNALGGRDRPEFFARESLLPKQAELLRESIPALRRELADLGVGLLGSEAYLNRIVSSAYGHRLQVDDCNPGRTFLFIDELGRVAPCSFTSQEYGLKEGEFASAENPVGALEMYFRAQRQLACAAACNDCPSTHVFTKFQKTHGS